MIHNHNFSRFFKIWKETLNFTGDTSRSQGQGQGQGQSQGQGQGQG